MIEVDCRKCQNLKADKSGCIFGNDAKKAVKKCAAHNFIFYAPKKKVEK